MKQAEDAATLALPLSDAGMQPIADIEAIGPYVRDKLVSAGITTRDELAELAVDEFTAITGQTEENAKALIVWARSHWFGNTESAPVAKWSTNDKKRIDPNWPFNLTVGTPEMARAAYTQAQIDAMWDDAPIPRAVKDSAGKIWSVLSIGYDCEETPRRYRINTWHKDVQDRLTHLDAGKAFPLTADELEAYEERAKAPFTPALTLASLASQRNALKVVQAVTTQRNPGTSFRERERLKRKAQRWAAKVQAMPPIEREYVLAAIANIATNGEGA